MRRRRAVLNCTTVGGWGEGRTVACVVGSPCADVAQVGDFRRAGGVVSADGLVMPRDDCQPPPWMHLAISRGAAAASAAAAAAASGAAAAAAALPSGAALSDGKWAVGAGNDRSRDGVGAACAGDGSGPCAACGVGGGGAVPAGGAHRRRRLAARCVTHLPRWVWERAAPIAQVRAHSMKQCHCSVHLHLHDADLRATTQLVSTAAAAEAVGLLGPGRCALLFFFACRAGSGVACSERGARADSVELARTVGIEDAVWWVLKSLPLGAPQFFGHRGMPNVVPFVCGYCCVSLLTSRWRRSGFDCRQAILEDDCASYSVSVLATALT